MSLQTNYKSTKEEETEEDKMDIIFCSAIIGALCIVCDFYCWITIQYKSDPSIEMYPLRGR